MKIKIASDNRVKKLPREKSTVKAALLRAFDDAQKDAWKKCIVVGKRKDNTYGIRHTCEADDVLLGMLAIAEHIITRDHD
jgi:hypothetical protein